MRRMLSLGIRLVSVVLVASLLSLMVFSTGDVELSTAASLTELQQQQKINQQKQTENKKNLASTQNDMQKEAEYQGYLSTQIDLIQENINLLEAQIAQLTTDIATKETEITNKQAEVDKSYEQFKERLRALYMAGDDSTLSIILGATSFYDMLSSAEWVKRIMKYDNDLIDTLTRQKAELEQLKQDLEGQKAQVDAAYAEADAKKAELNDSYAQSKAMSEQLAAEEKKYKDNQAYYDKMDAEIEKQIQEEIRRAASVGEYVGGQFQWPLPGFSYISSGFGMRWGRMHKGADITGSNVYGSNIVAANAGKVITAFTNDTPGYSYGKYVIIDHGGGYSTLYGHCSAVNVSVGQMVNKGDVIAQVGSTGDSTGPHLHFEIRVNGNAVNPMTYFTKK